MKDDVVRQTVASAVEQAYDKWAVEHPSLAAVIDRVSLAESTTESIRDSKEYREAVAAYHQGLSEVELVDKLTELAGPILTALLAG